MFNDVMLGVLSWGAPATLAATLENHARAGLPGLFSRAVVYLQEGTEAQAGIARAHGYEPIVAAENSGIFGGVDALSAALEVPFLILLENDHPLSEPPAIARDALARARADMVDERLDVMRLRARRDPGLPYRGVEKHLRAWGAAAPLDHKLPHRPGSWAQRLWRQTLRRGRETRHLASAIHVEQRPEARFPHAIRRSAHGNFVTDSRYAPWTNQCYMVPRAFLRDVVLARARADALAGPVAERTIETNLPRGWWQAERFRVGYSDPGVFTHLRLDR